MAETTALKPINHHSSDKTEESVGGLSSKSSTTTLQVDNIGGPISTEARSILFKGIKGGRKKEDESSDKFVAKALIKSLLVAQVPEMSMDLVRHALEFKGYKGEPVNGEFNIGQLSQFGEMRESADGRTIVAYSRAISNQNKVLSAPNLDQQSLAVLSQEVVILEDYDIPSETIEMVAITEEKREEIETTNSNQLAQEVSQPVNNPQTQSLNWLLDVREGDIQK